MMTATPAAWQEMAGFRRGSDEICGKAAERAVVTVASLIAEADEIQRLAIEAGQHSAAVSALTAKAKLAGLWVEKSDQTTRHDDPDQMSDAELARRLLDPSELN
jgi:hypothetical protein